MQEIHFCPKCHKLALKIESLPPFERPWLETDEAISIDDADREEELANAEPRVRVMSAGKWKTVLVINPNNAKNLSFGCPWGCKGKVKLFK